MRLADKITAGKIRDGDGEAFAKLLAAYQDKVFNYCFRICLNYHRAEELTQEVFLKVFSGIGGYDWRKASLSTWIYAITHNTCVNSLRITRNETQLDETDPAVQSPPLEERYVEKELLARLYEVLGQLPAEDRALILMKDYFGFRLADIGHIVNAPPGTVKSRLHYLRRKIRMMAGDPDDFQ